MDVGDNADNNLPIMLGDIYSSEMAVVLHHNVQSPYRTMVCMQTQHGQLREELWHNMVDVD